MTIPSGSRLGPYEVLSPIGAGGMGEVYRARDTRLGRDVAIKVLPPAFTTDADRLRRFEHEARTVGGLNHPNLVTLFDVGAHEGSPYLVMELLEGETLRQKLSGKPFPTRRAVEIACAVAEGLSAAHDRGIIHRDLKPENLFITRDGRVKILDFGLAKLRRGSQSSALDDLPTEAISHGAVATEAGTVLGTVGYMSPEQVRSGPVDARSDLFVLGVILWEMLTGSRPFKGASAVESMHSILKDDPPDSDPALKIPPVLERIVHTCLAKDPGGRFHSAHDLAFALNHLSGSTSSGISSQQAFPKASRLRTWALGTGAVAALAAAFFVGRWLSAPRLFHVERLTPSPRIISSARFLPDGKTIVYTAAPDGSDSGALGELFRMNPGQPPIPLGVGDCRVLDVSVAGELVLVWRQEIVVDGKKGRRPVLARMPAAGGSSPRVVEEEGVEIGDNARWTRDGRDLIVKKHLRYKGKHTQEAFVYQGRTLYAIPLGIGSDDFVLNEKGDAIGIPEWRFGVLFFVTVGLNGQVISRTPIGDLGGASNFPLSGDASFFPFRKHLVSLITRNERENPVQLVRTSPTGSFENLLSRLPTAVHLWDVSPKGDMLITSRDPGSVYDLRWLEPGAERERLVDFGAQTSGLLALNASGSQLSTYAEMGGRLGVHLLQAGQAAATNLGPGKALDQSPDGKTVLATTQDQDGYFHLRLLPAGAGAPAELPGQWINPGRPWLQEGGNVFVFGRLKDEPDPEWSPHLLDVQKGTIRRLQWRAAYVWGPLSPDGGSLFAVASMDGDWATWAWNRVDIASGTMMPLPSACRGMVPRGWTAKGEGIWLTKPFAKDRSFPMELWRCDLKTGKTERVRDIQGPGYPLAESVDFRITPDGRSYAYTYWYDVSVRRHLFLISGML